MSTNDGAISPSSKEQAIQGGASEQNDEGVALETRMKKMILMNCYIMCF